MNTRVADKISLKGRNKRDKRSLLYSPFLVRKSRG